MMEEVDLLDQAYDRGVPMGGVLALPHGEQGGKGPRQVPSFAIWVAKDPEGANLDRLQLIKGWVDDEGVSHEQVYDVAFSDGRAADASGKIPAVGNTVDIAGASYINTIGASQLRVFWQDPDFDPHQEAFYYARAIEIPTPRWSTYDAMRLGVEPPEPTSLQERAISSAIWYRVE